MAHLNGEFSWNKAAAAKYPPYDFKSKYNSLEYHSIDTIEGKSLMQVANPSPYGESIVIRIDLLFEATSNISIRFLVRIFSLARFSLFNSSFAYLMSVSWSAISNSPKRFLTAFKNLSPLKSVPRPSMTATMTPKLMQINVSNLRTRNWKSTVWLDGPLYLK